MTSVKLVSAEKLLCTNQGCIWDWRYIPTSGEKIRIFTNATHPGWHESFFFVVDGEKFDELFHVNHKQSISKVNFEGKVKTLVYGRKTKEFKALDMIDEHNRPF